MKKEVKKLHRMLLAAGIEFEYKPKTKCTVISWTTYDNDGRTFHEYEWSNKIVVKEGAKMVFKSTKAYVKFKGNDWDQVRERISESELFKFEMGNFKHKQVKYEEQTWVSGQVDYEGLTKVEFSQGTTLHLEPHELWEFLDKIDKAEKKGKQTVKFKGCESIFDFSK